ncbi:MAG TPA: HU family DNA-binding protein [Bacteroidales bacterium]|nr:HU family DNA-binding protein [Bacteroidales bacterium]HOX77227.1 HU family DNA-binding protein [Bacteroidales bacterium]HPI86829.1 HU family DNA-binding protein [Bacteroidales bacterium]HPM92363.1 HU family DNA-binding protein [Bacteroidales bacterium]
MSGNLVTSEIIEQVARKAGITKKLASELLHAIPEIIAEGLQRDGEVRVRGLGTFRMKWTQTRIGRNPKTGEQVPIPPHNRLVFLPEQAFKDFINRDLVALEYQVIPEDASVPEPEKPAVEIPEPIIISPSWPEPLPEPEPYAIAGTGIDQEPGSTGSRRRLHWIIPAAIAVIAILTVVFYFRIFREKEPVAVGSQQSAVGSQQPAVGSQQSADSSRQPAVGSQQVEESNNDSTLIIKNSELSIKNSTLITSGVHLFQVSRDVYEGNPYLWALIYKANREIITNPQNLPSGLTLIIPGLEGSPNKLSRRDSSEVSEGYRLLSEYYREKDPSLSDGFLKTSSQFRPE